MPSEIELPGFEVETEAPEAISTDAYTEAPEYGSAEWSDYVMSLFTKEEMFNGNPLCKGLRRVAQVLLGPIISSKPVAIWPALDQNGPGRSTVQWEVVIRFNNDAGYEGDHRVFGDVAETWHGNTDDIFLAHPTATAATKAEGRALRKALMVNCVAAEELTTKDVAAIVKQSVKQDAPTAGEMKDSDVMSKAQQKFLNTKFSQMDINAWKYLKSKKDYSDLTQITKKEASDMIQELNRIQQDGGLSEDLKGYDKDWESKK